MQLRKPMFSVCIAFLAILAAAPASAAALYPEDIILLLDSSGSIGSTNYAAIKTFARRINSQLPDRANSRIGIIQFSTAINIRYNLTDDQTPSAVDTAIANLVFPDGSTYVKNAVNAAISMFDTQSDPLSPRAIILLTDNAIPNPATAQNPTSLGPTLAAQGIYFLGVGYDPAFPGVWYTSLATDTGGANYNYPLFDDASADQFLTDAGGFFSLGFTPEPATASLLAAGVFGLTLRRRTRRCN